LYITKPNYNSELAKFTTVVAAIEIVLLKLLKYITSAEAIYFNNFNKTISINISYGRLKRRAEPEATDYKTNKKI